jgi:hypothetical protein
MSVLSTKKAKGTASTGSEAKGNSAAHARCGAGDQSDLSDKSLTLLSHDCVQLTSGKRGDSDGSVVADAHERYRVGCSLIPRIMFTDHGRFMIAQK